MTNESAMRHLCAVKAAALWQSFTDNEKACVRFGMFPAKPMEAAVSEGHDSRLLAVALMDCAKNNGGMVA